VIKKTKKSSLLWPHDRLFSIQELNNLFAKVKNKNNDPFPKQCLKGHSEEIC
jgi:hypothetical protein